MDVFLSRGVQGTTTFMAFVVSRFVCPYVTEIWEPWLMEIDWGWFEIYSFFAVITTTSNAASG